MKTTRKVNRDYDVAAKVKLLPNEVFCLRGHWMLVYNGVVPSTTWGSRGAAEAQLDLLRSGYSVITLDTGIRHIGAMKAVSA
jgi:hypothetical protein